MVNISGTGSTNQATAKQNIDACLQILLVNFWNLQQVNLQQVAIPPAIQMQIPFSNSNKPPLSYSHPINGYKHASEIYQSSFLLTLGSCFIVCNTALEDKFGTDKKLNNPSKNIEALRAVIYSARNAFAHNPANPIWNLTPYYSQIWDITLSNGDKITVNLTDKHGKDVNTNHFGGDTPYIFALFDEVKKIV